MHNLFQLFKNKFLNSSIRFKTVLCMVSLSLVTTSLVGFVCSGMYIKRYKAQSEQQVQETMTSASTSLLNDIKRMYRNITSTISDPLIQEAEAYARKGEHNPNFVYVYNQIQKDLSFILANDSLISNIVLVGVNNDVYSTHEVGIDYTAKDFEKELQQTSITWLPAEENPLRGTTGKVVPVCFPIYYDSALSFASQELPALSMIVYLNVDQLFNTIEKVNRTTATEFYIVNNQKNLIVSLPNNSNDELFENYLSKEDTATLEDITFEYDKKTYAVSTKDLNFNELTLVSLTSYQDLFQDVSYIRSVAVIAVVISLLLAVLIACLLSNTLVHPINGLLKQVSSVKKGNYEIEPTTTYNDEFHQLDQAICDMSSTISEQIQDIREIEAKHLHAEMDILTEQINPHFLYNTLDGIYWEILTGEGKNAANMVENLAAFLRLSLAKGEELVTLNHTLEHTKLYIDIMNFRFKKGIKFNYTIEPSLSLLYLPKMILQPLAENSIIHGFGGSAKNPSILNPEINVNIFQKDGWVIIEIVDNGEGFSIEDAQKNLSVSSSQSGHVGIQNVLQRLKYYFGEDTNMQFSSIPYYKNIVAIHIHPKQDEIL